MANSDIIDKIITSLTLFLNAPNTQVETEHPHRRPKLGVLFLIGLALILITVSVVKSQLEPGATDVLQQLYPRTGHAYIVGITGPPGSGKSTLTDKITKELRKKDSTVGIVAVDPSSPFSGGALLGDRLRR